MYTGLRDFVSEQNKEQVTYMHACTSYLHNACTSDVHIVCASDLQYVGVCFFLFVMFV